MRTFKISFLSAMVCVLGAVAAHAQALTGTAVIVPAFYSGRNIAAASTAPGIIQFAIVNYTGTAAYTQAPVGWQQYCFAAADNAAVAVFTHANGPNEPAANFWGPGAGGVMWNFTEGAVTKAGGIDGTPAPSSCFPASASTDSITLGVPATTGSDDLIVTWGNVSGGNFSFTGPPSYGTWIPANSGVGFGNYYSGEPVAVTYANSGSSFAPVGVQIPFLLDGATSTPSPAPVSGAVPPAYTGTAVVDNTSFAQAISLGAASTVAGNYQYAFVDYAGPGNYGGAPSGWTQVCAAKGAASIAAFAHLNGANEPASNAWGVSGTSGGAYALAIGAVANSLGVDGSVCNAPSNGAATITTGTPNIGSSGASDFTATWATVSGSAGSLTFSGPGNPAVWAPGASAAEGYYYNGVPAAVTYTNGSGTPHFSPLAAQIAFLPSGSAPPPTPVPTAAPTPAPTPTPASGGGSVATADPNANPAAKAELAYLYSLEGNHVIQGGENVVRTCMPPGDPNGNTGGSCGVQDASNYAAAGNKAWGAVGADPCNWFWGQYEGNISTPLCDPGAGGAAATEAIAFWKAGSVAFTQVDLVNPYDDYGNWAPASNPVVSDSNLVECPGSTSTPDAGASNDCTGISDAFITSMLTPGTQANTNFNQELSLYAAGFQAEQNAGMVIVIDPMSEINGTDEWYTTSAGVSPANEAAMFRYIETYFEHTAGLHNILYEWNILEEGYANAPSYPGGQYVDIVGIDAFPTWQGSSTTAVPGYNSAEDLPGGAASWGKPMSITYGCPTPNYDYDGQVLGSIKSSMPQVIELNYWWGIAGGTGGCTVNSSDWQAFMNDPNVLTQGQVQQP